MRDELTDRRPAAEAGPQPLRVSRSALLGLVVGLLCVLGLMMVLSASSVRALHEGVDTWLYFQRQLVLAVAGAVALAVVARVDYHRFQSAGGILLGLSFLMLLVLHVPGVGVTSGGSTRWLGVGPFVFQPSELAKLATLLFVADLLTRRAELMDEPAAVLRPVLVSVGAVAGLVLLQPDMGTTMLIVVVAVVLLFVGGLRLSWLLSLSALVGLASLAAAKLAPYRWARVSSFLDPGADPSNTGYQVIQSLVALGTGHFTGVGLGASRAKWGFLPNAHTDFIFAIIGEELGLLGSALVVGLFAAFCVLGVRIALRAPDRFGTLVAAGVTTWVVVQALVNLGGVVGLLPITGVPLPFVSFGGTSLLLTMVATGLLLNVALQGAALDRAPKGASARAGGRRGAAGGRNPGGRRS